MSGTVRKRCTCENKYQDSKYGKKVRVMNKMNKGTKSGGSSTYRCTVCTNEISVGDNDTKKNRKG